MRSSSIVVAAALAGLGLTLPLAAPTAHASGPGGPIMPVSEVKPGMKGYGLTVFRGTEPERFDVEVIDVLTRFRPNQDLILVKTSHPRLEVARVVAGMSGSPVYLDGKMVGAYAYGWQFPSEAVAGVTPIQSMLDELARPLPPMLGPTPLPSVRASAAAREPDTQRYAGDVGAYDLRSHARQLAQASPALAGGRAVPASTPLLLGGCSDGTLRLARDLFEPLGLDPVQGGGAGTGAIDASARYVDGGAIGVQMVSGDMSAMGTGTVTRVQGNRLVAFGHPMMNGGVSALPTAVARVVWVMATQSRSFKMAESVRPLGALVNDRPTAIVVDDRAKAPTFPVEVHIAGVDGAPHPDWSFRVAHDKFMGPSFVSMAIGNAFDTTTSERRDVTWHARTAITVRGHGTVTVDDVGVSVGGTPDVQDWAHARAVRAVGALLNNPWEDVVVEKVDARISVRFARDMVHLRGAEVLADVVDAGQPARVRLHLVPWAGREETLDVEVPLPPELAGREVEIELAPGWAEAPELPTPDRLDDLLANLPRGAYEPDTLVASIRLPEQGVAFRGHVASRLPPGAFDALRPAHDSRAPEPFVSYLRTSLPLHRLLDGKDRVRLRVRPVLH